MPLLALPSVTTIIKLPGPCFDIMPMPIAIAGPNAVWPVGLLLSRSKSLKLKSFSSFLYFGPCSAPILNNYEIYS